MLLCVKPTTEPINVLSESPVIWGMWNVTSVSGARPYAVGKVLPVGSGEVTKQSKYKCFIFYRFFNFYLGREICWNNPVFSLHNRKSVVYTMFCVEWCLPAAFLLYLKDDFTTFQHVFV